MTPWPFRTSGGMSRVAAMLALAGLALRADGVVVRHSANHSATSEGLLRSAAAGEGGDDEAAILAKGLAYISQGLDDVSRAYLMGNAPPIEHRESWAVTYEGALRALPGTGVQVDDHQGTPIGHGETIGLVAASFSLDPAQVGKLPEEFRRGLFGLCGETCPTWKAAVRVSHTFAIGLDLTRIAMKVNTDEYGEVDFFFTETVKQFPMKDLPQLTAFTRMINSGMYCALFRHYFSMMDMNAQSNQLETDYKHLVLKAGSLGKEYYGMTPFRLGDAGPTAGAYKVRLVAQQTSIHPGGVGKEFLENSRGQLTADVQLRVHTFSFEIQVATSAKDHKINDAYTKWSEDSSPWIRMGTMEIPQQSFEAPVTVGNVVGSGLWVDGKAPFHSKELLFQPANKALVAIGDINAFRNYLYPLYDKVRQRYLLGKASGAPATCPWAQMVNSP